MASIVVCDDEPHITLAIELKLRKAGHAVTRCANGAEGFQAVQSQHTDLVLTDCQMPVMNGLDLCRAIQEETSLSHVRRVMLTAKGFEIDAAELKRHFGVDRLVNKPFSPRELVDVVNAVLSSSSIAEPAEPLSGTLRERERKPGTRTTVAPRP